ncbi:hypothetical protein EDC04DRAFT_448336 [Pisolithus marmoratus]|nr:hypothetical protein EDC04DRAFT_448336 [Pisolithus marmoratus]
MVYGFRRVRGSPDQLVPRRILLYNGHHLLSLGCGALHHGYKHVVSGTMEITLYTGNFAIWTNESMKQGGCIMYFISKYAIGRSGTGKLVKRSQKRRVLAQAPTAGRRRGQDFGQLCRLYCATRSSCVLCLTINKGKANIVLDAHRLLSVGRLFVPVEDQQQIDHTVIYLNV